jgi:hypothetical protein
MPDTIGDFAPVNVRGGGSTKLLINNNPGDPLNDPTQVDPNAA